MTDLPTGWLRRGSSIYPEEWEGVVIVPTEHGYALCETDWEELSEPLFEARTQAACAAWWAIERSNGRGVEDLRYSLHWTGEDMQATCLSCQRYFSYEGSVTDFDTTMVYCGGSDRCIP